MGLKNIWHDWSLTKVKALVFVSPTRKCACFFYTHWNLSPFSGPSSVTLSSSLSKTTSFILSLYISTYLSSLASGPHPTPNTFTINACSPHHYHSNKHPPPHPNGTVRPFNLSLPPTTWPPREHLRRVLRRPHPRRSTHLQRRPLLPPHPLHHPRLLSPFQRNCRRRGHQPEASGPSPGFQKQAQAPGCYHPGHGPRLHEAGRPRDLSGHWHRRDRDGVRATPTRRRDYSVRVGDRVHGRDPTHWVPVPAPDAARAIQLAFAYRNISWLPCTASGLSVVDLFRDLARGGPGTDVRWDCNQQGYRGQSGGSGGVHISEPHFSPPPGRVRTARSWNSGEKQRWRRRQWWSWRLLDGYVDVDLWCGRNADKWGATWSMGSYYL